MTDCLFCKIANHELTSSVVYETDHVIAFEDIEPEAPVHVLVVPKQHIASCAEPVSPELSFELFEATRKVAELKGVDKTGYRLISNVGADGGQSVKHLHIHVLGGKKLQTQLEK